MNRVQIISLSLAAAFVVSCGSRDTAKIQVSAPGAKSSEFVVKALDINKFTVLDTLRTDENGKMDYKVSVKAGDPEFFYLYKDGKKVVSLLLEAGEKAEVRLDTTGAYSVKGSAGSELLAEFQGVQGEADAALSSIVARLDDKNLKEMRKAFNLKFIEHYRASVRFAMDNCKSLAIIPVLYQKVQNDVPVFGNINDGIIFKSLCDSLKTVYPESKYVKALEGDATRKINRMELVAKLKDAEQVGFPDVELKDKDLKVRRLSEVDSKCIILHFWDPREPVHKMFNLEVLMPLYKEYHKKGLQIYEVALTPDRTGWGMAIEDQKLPWISVCDIDAERSSYVATYNLRSLPTTFFISDGVLVNDTPDDLPSIRRLLDKLLK